MKTYNCKPYGEYDISLHQYHWGFEGVAVPDDSYQETIRLKMIGYTKSEMLSRLRDEIDAKALA
jgi:hypothetical protein